MGPTRRRLIWMRGIVWGLIGLIYAPLFIALTAILERFGAGPATYVAAAALAGAAGAALYGAMRTGPGGHRHWLGGRHLLLMTATGALGFGQSVVVSAAVAALVGLAGVFPGQCTRQIPGKVLAGLTAGALGGAVLAVAEPLHPQPFSAFTLLIFLVSVNGVLYVASVRGWISLSPAAAPGCWSLPLSEALVLATLPGLPLAVSA